MSSESPPTLETAERNKLLDTLLNNASTPKPASVLAACGSDEGGLDEFIEFILKIRSSSSMRFFNME